MPFTAAHPAAIIPLLRHSRRFSVTGLIAGSVSPDFQYFLFFPYFNLNSHSLPGILLFDLPVTFVLATLVHTLVRKPVVTYLPCWLQRRALAVPTLNWFLYLHKKWPVFLCSALIGAASHVFWDGFTHHTGYFVQQWPVLLTEFTILGEQLMLCRIIQHGSTLVGGLVILVYTWQLPVVLPLPGISMKQKLLFWSGVALAGLGFMVFALSTSDFMRSLMGVVVSLLSGMMLGTITLSLLLQLRWHRQRH